MFGCMFAVIAFGFWVFKVDYWVFYGFWGWIYECGATARCFMGFWVSLGVSLGV